MTEAAPGAAFGLYIHWPFCASKCPYCDFNSHVASAIDHDRWTRAYLSEIDRLAADTPGRRLSTVFFGGGTPSLMRPETVDAILSRIRASWTVANDLEVTLEANPGSVEAGRFRGFRDAGVDRISVGVQALDDEDLRRLGRRHTVAEALAAVEIARTTFARVSFDLIYARQGQTLDAWTAELTRALAFEPDHLSLYQLTIEPGTAFADRQARGGLRGLPDEDAGAEMFEQTQSLTNAAGLPAYEVSNHARPGQECRHNLIYWDGGDWGGIGPGAHGRLTQGDRRWATDTPRDPATWLTAVETTGSGEMPRQALSDEDRLIELLLNGLRTRDGIACARIEQLPHGPEILARAAALVDSGHLAADENALRTTDAGRLVLNAVLRELLA